MTTDSEVAVVGVGCRYPDAWTARQFWRNIDDGVVSMRELTEDQLRDAGFSAEEIGSEDLVRIGTTLPGVADFAAEFFGYSPRDAETMDPQQRIFLEVCWEALETAGHPSTQDGPVTGVFAGSAAGTYSAAIFATMVRERGLAAAIGDLDLTVGGQPDFLPSRVAYKLGLRGPALSVQTGCSSSLYAVHYATLSLLAGECDIALAGGATVLEPLRGYRYHPGQIQSADGYCRSFDARSSGTNHSSGVGVVVLRRLGDALADGDDVLAVLRGSAVGNDGRERLGYTAPSPVGVRDTITAALQVADVPADLVRYVEAHGTATAVGDTIELLALTSAFRASTDRIGYCALGSVMSNIGHTGPAAGISGFIKAVHVAHSGSLPPHPTFERARDEGVLAESPFHVPTSARTCPDADRHVLVNSMGVGGTNAAVVLAAPPTPTRPPARTRETVRLVLSGRTRTELDELSRRLADELDRGEVPAEDVAHTLRVGRNSLDERRVVTARADQLGAALRLPRPPTTRTVRCRPRHAIVVLPPESDGPTQVVERLRAALPGRTEFRREPLEEVPDDRFAILLGNGSPGPNRHVVDNWPDTGRMVDTETTNGPAGQTAGTAGTVGEAIEEALAAAWLHGVEVDWERLAEGTGRRVRLPTYPFTRTRFWALDRSSPLRTDQPPAARREQPAAQAVPDSLEDSLVEVWRGLFGDDAIGLDDEFGALGGTSLLSVQMALEIQQRHGVLVNLHRAGGSRATVRRIAELVRGVVDDPDLAVPIDRMDPGDNALVDADLQLPFGPPASARARGKDVLLTGATGFLGAFLLRQLLDSTAGRVYCVVRAADEAEGLARLRAAAVRLHLPEPDAQRVCVVPGDLRDIAKVCQDYRDGELSGRIGHVMHAAFRVVFTEPYQALREDNVLPLVDLVSWARGQGIGDFSFVSSVAATGPAMGTEDRLLETREQPLDPRSGGYGVSKWVGERLLERADAEGMRVRVFRPGLIMASTQTGACNDRDLIWFALASGLAVGAHPIHDQVLSLAPVDIVARGITELAMSPGSVGRAYHLVSDASVSLRRLFELLGEAGLPTEPVPVAEWQRLVTERARSAGNPVLSTAALLQIEGHGLNEDCVQAAGWQPWLRRRGLDPTLSGERLIRGLSFLARRDDQLGNLLADVLSGGGTGER